MTPEQQRQQQLLDGLPPVIIEDLKPDDDEDSDNTRLRGVPGASSPEPCAQRNTAQHPAGADFVGVPKDLNQQLGGEAKFLVTLPKSQHISISSSFSSMHLSAAHLQDTLSAVQQQSEQYGATSVTTVAQLLTETPRGSRSCSSSVTADLQLVSLSVEWHPEGAAFGVVGVVDRLSKIIPSCIELQLDSSGQYR